MPTIGDIANVLSPGAQSLSAHGLSSGTGSLNSAKKEVDTTLLSVWFDAADASTFTLDADGLVESWSNKGSLGSTATVSSSTLRPELESGGVRLPGVFFDNRYKTSNYKELNMGATYPFSTGIGDENGMTIFIVCATGWREGSSATMALDFGNYAATGFGIGCRPGYVFMYGPSTYGMANNQIADASVRVDEPVVFCMRFLFGTSRVCRVNGTQIFSEDGGTLTALTATEISENSTHGAGGGPFTLGRHSKNIAAGNSARSFHGSIHEVKLWRRSLTDDEMKQVEFELMNKWAVNHPTQSQNLEVFISPHEIENTTYETKTKTGTSLVIVDGSYAVTGVGTLFSSELTPGDFITVLPSSDERQSRQVVAITSDLSLTVSEPWSFSRSPTSFEYRTGKVTTLTNVGEAGNSFTQSDTALKPYIDLSPESGRRDLYFDEDIRNLEYSGDAEDFSFLNDGSSWTAMFFARVYDDASTVSTFFSTTAPGEIGAYVGYDNGSLEELRTIYLSLQEGIEKLSLSSPYDLPVERFALYTVTATRDDGVSTLSLYVDGTLIKESQSEVSIAVGPPDLPLTIGPTAGAPSRMNMSTFLLWSRLLDDGERAQWEGWHCRKFNHRIYDNPKAYEDNLVAWYDGRDRGAFEMYWSDGTGTVALDSSVSTTTLNGTGTAFNTELPANEWFRFFANGRRYEYQISAPIGDTVATTATAITRSIIPGTVFEHGKRLVSGWRDKHATSSSNDYEINAASAAAAPAYTETDTIPEVVGTAATPTYLSKFETASWAQPNTIYLVASASASMAGDETFVSGRTTAANAITADSTLSTMHIAGATDTNTGLIRPLNRHIYKAVLDGESSKFSIDGGTPVTLSAGTFEMNGVYMFADGFLSNASSSTISEVRIVNGEPTNDLRMMRGLSNRYGISVKSSPMNIPGCKVWYDFTDTDTYSVFTGTLLTTCLDKMANVAATASAGQEPTIVAGAINDLTTLRFDGTDNTLLVQTANLFNFLHNGTGGDLVVVLSRDTAGSVNDHVFSTASNSSEIGVQLYYSNASNFWDYVVYKGTGFTVASVQVSTVTYTNNYWRYIRVSYLGDNGPTDALMYMNTVLSGSNDPDNHPPTSSNATLAGYIGSSNGSANHYKGDIAEMIAFNNRLSSDEILELDDYMTAKYGAFH